MKPTKPKALWWITVCAECGITSPPEGPYRGTKKPVYHDLHCRHCRSTKFRILKSLRSKEDRDKIVQQWLGLPGYTINRKLGWLRKHIHRYGFDDANNVGVLTLIRAAELWDPSRGIKFNTYAINAIYHKIRDVVTDSGTVIHIPHDVFGRARRGETLDKKFKIAACRAKKVVQLEEGAMLLPAPVDQQATSQESSPLLAEALAALGSRERLVIQLRYYQKLTLRQIGTQLNISHERVRQIRDKALERLRETLDKQGLRCEAIKYDKD